MKKMLVFFLFLGLLITGCSVPKQDTQIETSDVTTSVTVSPTEMTEDSESITELFAVSVPATYETVSHSDGTELFSFTTQHMQLILPSASVSEKVVLDFLNRVDSARVDSESILAAAKNDYTGDQQWYPYFYQILYSPTRIDRGVLSLFGIQNSFSGGMHGNKSSVAVNYDLMSGDILTLGSIMHAQATKEDFIQLINAELGKHSDEYNLYNDYQKGVQNRLGGDENLYEDFYFTQTGLNFFFSPYEIAPYSSGIITIEIPYNALPGLIYDGYFPEEREQIQGKMLSSTFDISNPERFNNMAEVILSTDGSAYVAYPEGNVEDVRIHVSPENLNMPEYTVFAAYEMSDRDAVVIKLDKSMVDHIMIDYTSDNKTHTTTLND